MDTKKELFTISLNGKAQASLLALHNAGVAVFAEVADQDGARKVFNDRFFLRFYTLDPTGLRPEER